MADICVVYLSEDEAIVERLVVLLRKHWDVWWARDISHGDWELAVRSAIGKSLVVLPVLSQHTKGDRKTVLKDEMRLAQSYNKPILPFEIGPAEVPFGFGDFNRTTAHDWHGEESHSGYRQLTRKIGATIGGEGSQAVTLKRPQTLSVGDKVLPLPAFVFSLSSHETQVTPKEGCTLLRLLQPGAALVSAYDAWRPSRRVKNSIPCSSVKQLCESETVLFLDSGNYEAYRKNDRHSRTNPAGWCKVQFRETAARLSPDLAFSFDTIYPKGQPERIAERIVANFRADERALRGRDFPLCPIIHVPVKCEGSIATCAAGIAAGVAAALDPLMLAIPERELGDGLRQRVRTVRDIRATLNALGKYYPLHLLGTGNPLSMIALAAAGADAFDGLEWCRTVADYEDGRLFHFQQFECFSEACLPRVQNPQIRRLVGSLDVPYAMKALSYNVDFFEDWMRTVRDMIHAGQVETLLRMVPSIGPALFRDISA